MQQWHGVRPLSSLLPDFLLYLQCMRARENRGKQKRGQDYDGHERLSHVGRETRGHALQCFPHVLHVICIDMYHNNSWSAGWDAATAPAHKLLPAEALRDRNCPWFCLPAVSRQADVRQPAYSHVQIPRCAGSLTEGSHETAAHAVGLICTGKTIRNEARCCTCRHTTRLEHAPQSRDTAGCPLAHSGENVQGWRISRGTLSPMPSLSQAPPSPKPE